MRPPKLFSVLLFICDMVRAVFTKYIMIYCSPKYLHLKDVIISLTDPGWCRTDLGGPSAPNSPESSLPGVVVGAFVDNKKSGRCFAAPDFHGMTLEEAVSYAEKEVPVYLGSFE